MRSLSTCRVAASLYLLGLLFVSSLPQTHASSLAQLAGRSVQLQLVRADDLVQVQDSTTEISIGVSSAPITKQTTVYSILQANGIVPDSEAFSILYDLNPSLKDVKNLELGAVIQVPKISSGNDLANKLGTVYLVALTIDPEIRQSLNKAIDEFQTTANHLAALSPDHFQSPAQAKSVQDDVVTLAKWYLEIKKSFLRRTGPPLRKLTLLQLDDEVHILNALLSRLPETGPKLTESDQQQLHAIYQDVESEIRLYNQTLANNAPVAEALYKVVINIKGDNPSLIDNLRVYYTINGIFRDPPENPPVISYPFRQLGSGKSEALPVKNYKVWAARDGDPSHPVTPPLMVQISPLGGDKQEFDLSLNKGMH